MGQEYFINSQLLEDKIRKSLPSQGGAGAGFDLSASTQIIPIIDLTETAEGSTLRQDLQSSFSHDNSTSFNVSNTTTTIINNTGYFRIFGNCSTVATNNPATITMSITDGTTSKVLINGNCLNIASGSGFSAPLSFDFIVFCGAGDSVECTTDDVGLGFVGVTRQIASIDGTLSNPT